MQPHLSLGLVALAAAASVGCERSPVSKPPAGLTTQSPPRPPAAPQVDVPKTIDRVIAELERPSPSAPDEKSQGDRAGDRFLGFLCQELTSAERQALASLTLAETKIGSDRAEYVSGFLMICLARERDAAALRSLLSSNCIERVGMYTLQEERLAWDLGFMPAVELILSMNLEPRNPRYACWMTQVRRMFEPHLREGLSDSDLLAAAGSWWARFGNSCEPEDRINLQQDQSTPYRSIIRYPRLSP